jgi:hypothetical protein
MEHVKIDPQPKIHEDGYWPMHSQDEAGKWYRPAGLQIPGLGPYPLFDPPNEGLTHAFCKQHQQWEWVDKSECEGNYPTCKESL